MVGRWRWFAAGLLTLALLAVPMSSQASARMVPAPVDTRAMWVWSDLTEQVVEWADQRGVTNIFANVPEGPLSSADLVRLRAAKARAQTLGVTLSALGGDPHWVLEPARALNWQRTVEKARIFAGYHVDVEPYLLPGWETNRTGTATAYLKLLNSLNKATTLPVEADVPFWLGQFTGAEGNLATATLQRVDSVTVMAYRDTAAGVWSVSQDWLARGALAGKRVRIGIDTGPNSECGYCTFATAGATALGAAMADIDDYSRNAPAFSGIAVHHYDAWRDLPA